MNMRLPVGPGDFLTDLDGNLITDLPTLGHEDKDVPCLVISITEVSSR